MVVSYSKESKYHQLCASVILKLNNQKMNLVQSSVSLVLKAGHATKQVNIIVVYFVH